MIKLRFKKLFNTALFLSGFSLMISLPTQAAQNQRLPRPEKTLDPVPPAPKVKTSDAQLTQQAGVGGNTGYARAGVLELGGSLGFSKATNITEFSIGPSIGWFIANNWQLSAIFDYTYSDNNGSDANFLYLLAEPSFHFPLSNTHFVFAGFGAGLSYNNVSDKNSGMAIAPRVGFKTLIGRSGILTASARQIFSTHEAIRTDQGTLIGLSSAFTLGVGYSVLF